MTSEPFALVYKTGGEKTQDLLAACLPQSAPTGPAWLGTRTPGSRLNYPTTTAFCKRTPPDQHSHITSFRQPHATAHAPVCGTWMKKRWERGGGGGVVVAFG